MNMYKRYTLNISVVLWCFSLVVLLAMLIAPMASSHAGEPRKQTKENEVVLGNEPGNTRMQNADLGIILWGPSDRPTLSVGKSDVWDRRLIGNVPVTVQHIRDILNPPEDDPKARLRALAVYGCKNWGELRQKARQAYNRHDFPCPKPVGQLILGLPFMHEGNGGKLNLRKGEDETYSLQAQNGNKELTLKVYVHAVRNLIILDGEAKGLDKGDLWVRVYRHWDTITPGGKMHPTAGDYYSLRDFERMAPPASFHEKESFGICQDFPAEMTFPDGFRCVFSATIQGATVEYRLDDNKLDLGTPMIAEKEGRISHMITKRFTPINKAPGAAATAYLGPLQGTFRIIATVVTTQDDSDPKVAAVHALTAARAVEAPALLKQHADRLDDFRTGKIGTRYKPRPPGYYGDIGLSVVSSTKFCFQDSSPWHGDFHFNNGPQSIPVPRKNYASQEPWFHLIETILPIAKRQARDIYGCSGAAYSICHFPLKAKTFYRCIPWDDSLEMSGGIMRNVWKRFLYTWDIDYLRKRGYPLMREVARFYADYVTKGEDGLYHVIPTVSSEHWRYTANFKRNKDSNAALSMVKYHLRASSRAAALLGLDEKERSRWVEIADHMAPYPLYETPEGPIFVDVAGAPPIVYNIAANLANVWLGNDVGLDSSPKTLEIARRTYERIKTNKPHGDGYKRQIAPRLGIYYAKRGISRENLLQSHTGVIRVFPAVPEKGHQEFKNYLAEGAFEGSAQRTDGQVAGFTVHSMAGQDCLLANPWKGTRAKVIDASVGKEVKTKEWQKYGNDYLSFRTTPGRTYRIEAEDGR